MFREVDNDLSIRAERVSLSTVKLLLENLPASLQDQRDTLAKCLEAMNQALPLHAVYLFGSHARGEARRDSDVDLCFVADGATEQLKAARKIPRSDLGHLALSCLHADPDYAETAQRGKNIGDHFFATVLKEGLQLAA